MKKLGFLFSFLITFSLFSQQQEDAWFFLRDKPDSTLYISNPLLMLSQRAIDRRNNLQIEINGTDVPMHQAHIDNIKAAVGITVLGKSKWLNAVHIQGTKIIIDNYFLNSSFIKRVEFANKTFNNLGEKAVEKMVSNHQNKFNISQTDFNYGSTSDQIKMLKGNYLHAQGLTGAGQIIAVIDAGFPNVNTLEAFKRLRENNQILGGYDFVERSTNFYAGNNHGTNVLSTIGGYLENQFVGAAPDASFYLFRTENAPVEVPLEETLWVEAAERADSLGVDVINTSLGYSTFDNADYNYSYADMNGKTTFISRGAEIAGNKGILVVNSAGNSGNNSWKYITAPADAPSVITVGAVDKNKSIANFSSFGPTSDGRIKPEILALGVSAAVINHTNGAISLSNGTSFSSPIMAGLIACLNGNEGFLLKSSIHKKSKKQKKFNDHLKEAVYTSANTYSNPTDQYGYGIPDFEIALNKYIGSTASLQEASLERVKISPNPVTTIFKIEGFLGNRKGYKMQIFDVLGKQVLQKETLLNEVEISFLETGLYFLKISKENQYRTIKIIKN
ncbi:S8 family serine peptidase [Polaribacter sp. IC073]|uniref:S8 family serine peptidase n=1 Tax=Polaribacter sp. IC073 TaxID=2508540 RepID=UPI0011BE4A64|nr:S8 family serine peptidase [Polaribacter sp. IC073]TXD45914.1 S8 family serine peptidase [Polaribacter sp. IC073]